MGWQVGEISDWRCAVDPDCPEAEKLAPTFLPDTLKAGKGGVPSLYFYRSPTCSLRADVIEETI